MRVTSFPPAVTETSADPFRFSGSTSPESLIRPSPVVLSDTFVLPGRSASYPSSVTVNPMGAWSAELTLYEISNVQYWSQVVPHQVCGVSTFLCHSNEPSASLYSSQPSEVVSTSHGPLSGFVGGLGGGLPGVA